MSNAAVDTVRARQELVSHLSRLDGELNELEKAREASRQEKDEYAGYGNHVGEAASETSETERNLAVIDQLEHMREAVKLALVRLDDGTYGQCVTCGQPIPAERLEALPFAEQCVSCKSKENHH
ncbi:MAG: TraR/DksA C4-type zinc finger protein [Candidatus Dormiibacterota bacterium]